MGQIVNVRIDGRLIHGQVCTQWVIQLGAKKIFIVDDVTAKDAFLSQICVMASPVGTTLECITCEEAAKRFKEDPGMGTEDKVFVIFKTLEQALKAYNLGFHYQALNFGTTLNKGNMINTGVGALAMDPEHAQPLQDCVNQGLKVTFQVTPSESCVSWDTVRNRLFPNVK